VYANRRRVKGSYGKRLMKKRGELIERSFAHCYETGAMRRVYLRGSENILKRQLIHVGAFNLSLIFRQKLGAGTPRELANRQAQAIFFVLLFTISSAADAGASPALPGGFNSRVSVIDRSYARNC
jgi:transposase